MRHRKIVYIFDGSAFLVGKAVRYAIYCEYSNDKS